MRPHVGYFIVPTNGANLAVQQHEKERFRCRAVAHRHHNQSTTATTARISLANISTIKTKIDRRAAAEAVAPSDPQRRRGCECGAARSASRDCIIRAARTASPSSRHCFTIYHGCGLCWYSDNVGYYSPPDNSKCGSKAAAIARSSKSLQVGDGGWGDCSGFAGTQILIASMCIQEQQPQEKQQQQVVSESGATRAAAAAGDEEASIRPFYGIDNGDNQTEYPWVVDDWLEDGMKGWIAEEEAAEEEQEQGLASCGISPPISATNGVAWGALRLPAGMRRALTTLGTPPWHWYLILHQRHPGDTLVSEYHSFGWTHPPPPNASPEQKRRHAERQAVIRNTSAAKYVSDHLEDLRSKYVPYMEVLDALKQQKLQRGGGSAAAEASGTLPALDTTHLSIIRSKYEELVTDFAKWLDTLLTALATSYTRATLDIVRAALLEKHKRSFDPNGKHKKSVKPGRYDAEVLPAAANEHKKRHAAWWAPLGYA